MLFSTMEEGKRVHLVPGRRVGDKLAALIELDSKKSDDDDEELPENKGLLCLESATCIDSLRWLSSWV